MSEVEMARDSALAVAEDTLDALREKFREAGDLSDDDVLACLDRLVDQHEAAEMEVYRRGLEDGREEAFRELRALIGA